MKSDRATAERDDGQGRSARTVPDWITSELIDETVRVWQPYYAEPLTVEDAAGMLTGAGRLLSVLTGVLPPAR